MLLNEREANRICRQLLSYVQADDATVTVLGQTDHHLRFAANRFTTSGQRDDVEVTVTVWVDRKKGSVSTNEIEEASLAAAVREAEQIARLSPVDPEYLPSLGPQRYRSTRQFVGATADSSVTARAGTIHGVISQCEQGETVAAGLHRTRGMTTCTATKNGNLLYERSSLATLSVACRTPDGSGSGFCLGSHYDVRKLDSARIARRAVEKAVQSRGARAIDPGAYTVILEPQAVHDLLLYLQFSLDARSAEEGRSPFSAPEGKTRVGQSVFDERINLFSDPWHPELPGPAATPGGIPAQRYYLVRNGVLENLTYSRFWAAQKQKAPSPGPVNTILETSGPRTNLEEMIASTDRGLLVTRFWYVRYVNPRSLLLTGLTRDGLWFVENGRIQFPVRNLRFNQNLLEMLAPGNIELIGASERVSSSEGQGFPSLYPALKVRHFRFTSQSDAI